MPKITGDEVQRLAKLAHIGLSEAEVERFSVELDRIVEFVQQLQKVDVADLDPTDHVTGLTNVVRPDEVNPSNLTQAELLANVPEREDGYIKVRRVLGD